MNIDDKLIGENVKISSNEDGHDEDDSSVDEDDDESSIASLDDNLDCLLDAVESNNDNSLHE